MKDKSTGLFEYDMVITGLEYDEGRAGWNYSLKDANGIAWSHMVPETELKRSK